jgi:hypothetical protein
MRKIIISISIFCVLCNTLCALVVTEGDRYIIDGEAIDFRLDINASEYEIIVFRNTKFNETVLIRANESLKIINIYNCDFADMLSIRENPALSSLAITSGNFKKHVLVNVNSIEDESTFVDNFITGYFQFSGNQIGGRCAITLSRIESGISCFGNTFGSMFEISAVNSNGRSVMADNRFNEVELNDVIANTLQFQKNYLEKSMGFADCTIDSHFTLRQMYDSGSPDRRRSMNFYNTSVHGSIYFDEIDETIFLLDLWQLDFSQDFFIDNSRLFKSVKNITQRVVHSPQSIESIAVTNPYKELGREDLRKFMQFLTKIKTGYDKRGEQDAKINFIKWQYHFKNDFNAFPRKIINRILFVLSFELFLNIKLSIIFSLLICIAFMFLYARRQDKANEYALLYLDIDNAKNDSPTGGKKIPHLIFRCGIAFLVSTSIFCNLPLATNKLREDKAKNLVWIESFIGLIMLIIISAIVGRISVI